MNVEGFYRQLEEYFQKEEVDKVEPYLISTLETVREEEDYAAYIAVGNEMIGFYRSISSFKKAFDIAEDVLLLMEELQLENGEHFASTLLNTAAAYREAGNPQQAYKYCRQALNIYHGILPADDRRFAGLYNDMSILLEQMDQKEEAAGLLEQSLALIKKQENSEKEQAVTLTDLALLYFRSGKTERAAEVLEEALHIFEAADGGEETDAHYSAALAGAGEVCYRMGDYEKSLASYEKALAEVKKHFGENQSYAMLCKNCAAVCHCLNLEDKAEHYREQAQSCSASSSR